MLHFLLITTDATHTTVNVSCFNGISTFVGYLMPKPSLQKNGGGTIYLIAGGIRILV